MATGLLTAELAATCNALGYFDGQTYQLEPHCSETVKDLIRYLRRDEDTHDIRRYLGNAKLVQTDLIPIIQTVLNDKELFDVVLRLLVNLTNPALLIYNEVVPTDKTDRNHYLEIVSHLQGYKEAFTCHKVWISLTERLSGLLKENISDRDDDSQRCIERILILVRNIFHVPANVQNEFRPDNDASIHDQVIWALHQSGMLDLILYVASSAHESHFYMHILEIICLMVREQSPSLLAQTVAQRSLEEKERDDKELLRIRQLELREKQQKLRKYGGTRHSNFGGTFVVKNMKSISDREMIYHKPLHTAEHISLDSEKKRTKTPKNRMALKCESTERRSALSVRLILKQFCIEILNAAYNPLMRQIREFISRGKSQENDESYYFNALKFFMEFNRNYKFQVKLVSETMSIDTFHFVQKYLETWHEMMVTDKKKIYFWSTRMHISLKAYKELLYNLMFMDQSADASVRESSKVIKSNIFYVLEYREMLLVLANSYKKTKYSDIYLKDLMETVHIYLKLLENFGKNKKLYVQKKARNTGTRKKKIKSKVTQEVLESDEIWKNISSDLEAALRSEIKVDVIPFDAVSDKDMDSQKVDAIKRIQQLMKSNTSEEAVGLLRASREVWPENDCFGSPEMSVEEELECLREVYFADLQQEQDLTNIVQADCGFNEEEEEEEENSYQQITEQSLDVNDFIKRFASPKVLCICNRILKTFDKNSVFTNHVVAKMMHRIAWDLKLPAMLFQASLFRTFQQILKLNDRKYKELEKLAVFIVRKFVDVTASNKKVFMELLFWKSAKEAYEIEHGYGSFQENSKAAKITWQEHEEDELRRLCAEFERDKPSTDMVEWVMENMINKDRSKRSVVKKLRELYLIVDKPKQQKKWTEELEMELASLFNEFKGVEDPVGSIKEKLSSEKSRGNIIKTLLQLGLVQNRQELYKKRRSKKSMGLDKSQDAKTESDESDYENSREVITQRSYPKVDPRTALVALFGELNQFSYLEKGLQWLASCIQDSLEDLDDDDDETEVPLLPLSKEALMSIENTCFQQFLLSLGIYSPFKEQEIYWRFPAGWKEGQLRHRLKLVEFLEKNCSKAFSDLEEDIKSILRDIFDEAIVFQNASDKICLKNSSDESDSSDDENANDSFTDIIMRHCQQTINGEVNVHMKTGSSNMISLDDSSKNQLSPSSSKNISKKRTRISSDSSDNEQRTFESHKKTSTRQQLKVRDHSDSESENKVNGIDNCGKSEINSLELANQQLVKTLNNDNSDEEVSANVSKVKKKRLIIESDEDDE